MSMIAIPPMQLAASAVDFTGSQRGAGRPALMAHSVVRFAIQFGDFVAIGAILWALAIGVGQNGSLAVTQGLSLRVLAGLVAMTVWASQVQLYDLARMLRPSAAMAASFSPLLVGLGVDVLALFAGGASWRPLAGNAALALLAGVIYIFFSRSIWARVCRAAVRSGRLAYRVAVVGPGCDEWLSRRSARRAPFLSVVGQYDGAVGGFDSQAPELGRLLIHAKRRRVDAIVLCYPEALAERRRHAFTLLRASVAEIFMHDDIALCPLLPREHPLTGFAVIPLQRRALTDGGMLLKTLIDRVGGLLVLALLSPLLALTALVIRLDSPGPIFFRQPRVGYNNVLFEMFKFRSMHTHMSDQLAIRQTAHGDPRITRIGRTIRRFSIDELPQLLNVLRGEMSLVGPRPHAPGTNVDGLLLEHASPYYPLRHRVLPGITGWAQINGSRGALCTPDQLRRRVRLDLFYIEKCSVLLDLKIMFLTATREVLSRRAC